MHEPIRLEPCEDRRAIRAVGGDVEDDGPTTERAAHDGVHERTIGAASELHLLGRAERTHAGHLAVPAGDTVVGDHVERDPTVHRCLLMMGDIAELGSHPSDGCSDADGSFHEGHRVSMHDGETELNPHRR